MTPEELYAEIAVGALTSMQASPQSARLYRIGRTDILVPVSPDIEVPEEWVADSDVRAPSNFPVACTLVSWRKVETWKKAQRDTPDESLSLM